MPETVIVPELRGRRSAIPLGAKKVVMSMTRNQRRVTSPPVLLTTRRRRSSVPKVELFNGSDVKSRTRLGGLEAAFELSSKG
jgi:hypothetical protein